MRGGVGMFRRILVAGLSLLLGFPSAASAERRGWKPTTDDVFYIACYLFTSGEPVATGLPVVKTNGKEMFNNFENYIRDRALPIYPQHHNIRCVPEDTPELAIQARIKHGYVIQEAPWPKGLPEGARPIWVEGMGMIPADRAPKPPEPEKPGAPAPKPPPKPAPPPPPKPAPPPAALIIKEDTSAKDFRKAFDEQVAKDLAAQDRKRAEAAAKGAQADAEMQRRIKQVMDERRRRGPAQ